jgi:hypothetical protein
MDAVKHIFDLNEEKLERGILLYYNRTTLLQYHWISINHTKDYTVRSQRDDKENQIDNN